MSVVGNRWGSKILCMSHPEWPSNDSFTSNTLKLDSTWWDNKPQKSLKGMSPSQIITKSTQPSKIFAPHNKYSRKFQNLPEKIDGHANILLKFFSSFIPIFTAHKKCFDIPQKTTNPYPSNKFQCDNIIK